MTTEQNEKFMSIRKFTLVLFLTTIASLVMSLLIPLALMDVKSYFDSFVNLIPTSGNLLIAYFMFLIISVGSIIFNVLLMFDAVLEKIEYRVKILLVYSNAMSPTIFLLLNFLMIWLDMWSAGGSGILFFLSLAGIYQVRFVSSYTFST